MTAATREQRAIALHEALVRVNAGLDGAEAELTSTCVAWLDAATQRPKAMKKLRALARVRHDCGYDGRDVLSCGCIAGPLRLIVAVLDNERGPIGPFGVHF